MQTSAKSSLNYCTSCGALVEAPNGHARSLLPPAPAVTPAAIFGGEARRPARPVLRLLVADDQEVVRTGVRALARERAGWEVVAEAADGREAVAKSAELKPDVAILEITMPVLNGVEAARQIVKASPRTKVLILTAYESEDLIQKALDAGARGFLLKTDPGCDLLAAVETVSNDRTFFTPKVAQKILDGYKSTTSGKPRVGHKASAVLTPRQTEVVQLVAEGRTSKEVAAALGITVKTADTHRSNILRALNYHSRTDLIRYAIRNHIITA